MSNKYDPMGAPITVPALHTHTLNGSFGSDVNVILNVTFAEDDAVSVELLLNGNEANGEMQTVFLATAFSV